MASRRVHSVERVSCVMRVARSGAAPVSVAVIVHTIAASRAIHISMFGLYIFQLVGGPPFAAILAGVSGMNNGMTPLLRTALTLLFIGSLAAPARADWYLTPYIGAAFGGASNQF